MKATVAKGLRSASRVQTYNLGRGIFMLLLSLVLVVGMCPLDGFAQTSASSAAEAQSEADASNQDESESSAPQEALSASVGSSSTDQTIATDSSGSEVAETESLAASAAEERVLASQSEDAASINDEAASSADASLQISEEPDVASVGAEQEVDSRGETVERASFPLHPIQNGNYAQYIAENGVPVEDVPEIASVEATSTDNQPTAEIISEIKNRVNTGLMNVETNPTFCDSDGVYRLEINVRDLNIRAENLTVNNVSAWMDDVINSNPDLFYAGQSAGWSRSITYDKRYYLKTVYVCYNFDPATIRTMKVQYANAMADLLSWVPAGANQMQKAKAVHDWLVRNCAYHNTANTKGNPAAYGSWNPWTAYGALVLKSPVCEGYSLAFKAAMQRLGMDCTFVTQFTSRGGHGWNRVKIDGSWYNLDVTFDDPLADQGFSHTPNSTYFLKSDAWWRSHQTGGFHGSWSPAGVAGTNTKYDGYTASKWPVYSGKQPITVKSFDLSSSTLSMKTMGSATLSIKNVNPSGANIAAAKWTSSNPKVAAVDSMGHITTGATVGTATITCSVGGTSRACTVTVVDRNTTMMTSANTKVTCNGSTAAQIGYTGSPVKPTVVVICGGKTLRSGTDYTLTYPSDATSPGAKTITITGKGAYAGTFTSTYYVTAPLSKTIVTAPADVRYNGASQRVAPRVTFNGKALVENTDFTLSYPSDTKSVGTKTVTINGKGTFSGSRTYSYKVTAATISSGDVSVASQVLYTGSPVKPAVTVTIGGNKLTEGVDYTVSCTNNIAVGVANVTITGKGNCTGTVSRTFRVVASLSSATVGSLKDVSYTGAAYTPEPVVSVGGRALVKGTDYTLSYANNVEPGTATVTVSGKGNYQGTKTATFKIVATGITGATVDAIPNAVYTGQALAPSPTVRSGGKVLVKGTDYTLSYANNVNVGTATVTVLGKGRYSGAVTATFKITKAAATLTASPVNVSTTAGAAAQTVSVAYKGDGVVTVKSSNTTVATATYANGRITIKPLVAGKATITVSAAAGKNYNAAKNAVVNVTVGAKAATYPANYTGWKTAGGKSYYYIKGVKQGTKGRGCEIYDGKGWFWLDAVQGGAKTVNKDVFIPNFYSNDSMNASNQSNGAFGKWVHYDANGQMLKGWQKVNGKQYYFDKMTGEMAHGTCYLPSGGKRVSVFDAGSGVYKGSNNNTWWEYWYENGAKQGVQGRGKEIYDPYSKAWYWLDSLYNGKKAVNKEVMIPYTYQGKDNITKWVRYNSNGGMVKGWYKLGSKQYYYDPTTGGMVKGWRTIDGKARFFDYTTGVMR